MNIKRRISLFRKSSRKIQLQDKYDILIVGGGIYGATLSYVASMNGYKVLLVEKNDYASGTSSNSLKILHGGIRYLQSFDFIRVIESAKERARLTRLMPNLVRPITCLLPIKTGFTKNKFFMLPALVLFDFIRKVINKRYNVYKYDKSKIVTKNILNKTYKRITDIKENIGLCWQDSQVVSTERMVYKFISLAKKNGADTCNYVNYIGSAHESDRHIVELLDEIANVNLKTSVNVIVDATSSWQINKPNKKEPIPYVSAVNLIVNKQLSEDTIGIPFVKDNISRTLFLSPWNSSTLIGTWYFNELNEVNENIIDECLDDIKYYIKNISIKKSDISFIHHGKLPSNKNVIDNPYSDIQNQYKILNGILPGIYIVQGVKYTTAMDVAEKTVVQINKYFENAYNLKYPVALQKDTTETVTNSADSLYDKYKDQISLKVFYRLVELYGEEVEKILTLTNTNVALLEYVPSSNIVLKAEIEYLLEQEEVYCLSDLLLRRTDIGTQAKPHEEMINYCANKLANHYKWDSELLDYNYKELDKYYPSWVN